MIMKTTHCYFDKSIISPTHFFATMFCKSKSPKKSVFEVAFQFLGGSDGKVSAYNVRDPGSIPGLERSLGEGNSRPLQYSCLENPMDKGAW